MKNIIVIPARSGSKGIKNKNIITCNSKPLITWTFMSCLNICDNYEVVVCTNMQEVKNIGKNFKYNCDYERPEETSQDDTSMYTTILDLLNWYERANNETVEKIILLQPTNPLRSKSDVIKVIKKLDEGFQSCFTVVPTLQSPYEIIEMVNNKWNFLKKDSKAVRRQEYNDNSWFIDGSIYGCTRNFFKKYKSFIDESISLPIKCSKSTSWDIDTPLDLAIAERMLFSLKK